MPEAVHAVIGANFGDEGKGLATDYLSSLYGKEGLVVRFNGGAQAGHTVATPDGKRHVFSHVGSGAFNGSSTFLSRFFVTNPILFLRELTSLKALGVNPRLFVDPGSPVTTPYDMMLNQHIEQFRDNQRHGSCGLGFGETLERNNSPTYRLIVGDLQRPNWVQNLLNEIRKKYVPQRLLALGIGTLPEHLYSDDVRDRYLEDCDFFLNSVNVSDANIIGEAKAVVFEGAQGLMLDMVRGYWPHVTRSSTGLTNVAQLAVEAAIKSVDVHYITRPYLTRHGAGPLPNELNSAPQPGIDDRTNLTNAWQGSLRFARHDADILKKFIKADLSEARELNINHHLFVTCLDQIDSTIEIIQDGRETQLPISNLASRFQSLINARSVTTSRGESRLTIENACSM